MAGTLTISTLSDGTNSTSATNCIQGSAKAWVNFNGVTTATIRSSYNVSSVTRNTTGGYTVNFTNAFSDTNYVITGTNSPANPNGDANSFLINCVPSTLVESAPTTSSFTFTTTQSGVGGVDCKYISVAVFR